MINSGTSEINGTRSADLIRVSGVFEGRYATKGNGTNILTITQSSDWRNYWTVDFWVKFTSAELSGTSALFGRYTAGYRMLSTWCADGKLWIYCTGSGGGAINIGTTNAVITADTWHHVRYSYGSESSGQGTMKISVDGTQVLSAPGVGSLLEPDGVITIFAVIDATPGSVFRGTMADFRFYASQLSSTYTVPESYYDGIIPEPEPEPEGTYLEVVQELQAISGILEDSKLSSADIEKNSLILKSLLIVCGIAAGAITFLLMLIAKNNRWFIG